MGAQEHAHERGNKAVLEWVSYPHEPAKHSVVLHLIELATKPDKTAAQLATTNSQFPTFPKFAQKVFSRPCRMAQTPSLAKA